MTNELSELAEQPVQRRWWLLCKALERTSLDRALELAGAAEKFITGCPAAAQELPELGGVAESTQNTMEPLPASGTALSSPNPVAKRRPSLGLSLEQRAQLIARLAAGAKNADLAHEFGLSPKQIQGIRIGSSREILARRDQLSTKEATSSPSLNDKFQIVPSIEEVVRYLRQQDDVVVRESDGRFAVNGRLHLSGPELISRANRMRARQSKPEFKLANGSAPPGGNFGPRKNHPLFWEGRSA